MIEKLKNIPLDMNGEPSAVWTKINELVDAVNEQQLRLDNFKHWLMALENAKNSTISKMENVDPYAEQRRWIGCVCRFWYDNPDDTVLDYLGKIQTGENGIEYYGKETYDWFPHCEPILPTDNAIYKGGDNE